MDDDTPEFARVPRLLDNFFAKVDASGDCWEWTGRKTAEGYGRTRWGETNTWFVHRLVWELMVGPIPQGLEVDHLCYNEGCVNPDHLEPVTRAENLRRRRWSAAHGMSLRTHCPRDHPYDEANTHWTKRGSRQCKACWAVYRAKARRKVAA